jgi:hypothetical protein
MRFSSAYREHGLTKSIKIFPCLRGTFLTPKIKLKDIYHGHANMVSLIAVHILPLRFCL